MRPRILESLIAPMVTNFILGNSRILWVPHHEGSGGAWEPVSRVCLLPEGDPPSSSVICVARRAGLRIPDAPDHVLKVCVHVNLQLVLPCFCRVMSDLASFALMDACQCFSNLLH